MVKTIDNDPSLDHAHLIATSRPDMGTAASFARSEQETQNGIEHACRTLRSSPEACAKAIKGISTACESCVRQYLATRGAA